MPPEVPGDVSLLDSAPDAILVASTDGHIVFGNEAAHVLFRCAPGGLTGTPVERLVPTRFVAGHARHRAQYVAAGMPSRAMGEGRELAARRLDGSEFPAEISLRAIAWHGVQCVAVAVRDVSPRHAAARRELEYREQLRALIEHSPDLLVRFAADGTMRFVNETLLQLTSTDAAAWIGRTLDAAPLDRSVRDAWGERLQRLTATVPVLGLECELDTPRGPRTFDCRFSAELDAESAVTHIVLVARDITEARRARAQQQLFHEVSLAIRAATTASEAIRVTISRVCETLGWDCACAWHPDERGVLRARERYERDTTLTDLGTLLAPLALEPDVGVHARALARRHTVWVRDIQTRADEASAPVAAHLGLTTTIALPVVSGTHTFVVLSFFARTPRARDVAHEALLESVLSQLADALERRRAIDALESSESRLRAIVDGAPIGIALLDRDGNVVSANLALRAFLADSDAHALVGRSFCALLPDDAADRLRTVIGAAGQQTVMRPALTLPFVRQDGVTAWGRVHLARAGRSATPLFLAMIEDVSTEVAAEERLRHSESALHDARKLEAIGRLASGIAHDFNNLLAVVRSTCDLLWADSTLSAPARARVEAIRLASDHGGRLTAQLLASARRRAVPAEWLDVGDSIRDLHPLLERLAGPLVRVELALSDEAMPARLPRTHLEQALLNLIINARDAMPGGGGVRISSRTMTHVAHADGQRARLAAGRYHCLEVTDEGIGMPQEIRARIFEPFFSTKTSHGGTGLGLATVHSIMTQMGGGIDVDSTPGRGTTFRLYVPAVLTPHVTGEHAIPRVETASRALATPVAMTSDVPLSMHTDPRESGVVLVVDDQPAVLEAVVRLLRHLDYDVLACSGADEALDAAARLRPRLLLTDVTMPHTDGVDLAHQLERLHPGLPVVFMSGFPDEPPRLADGREGALLIKPFSLDALSRAMRDALDHTPPPDAPHPHHDSAAPDSVEVIVRELLVQRRTRDAEDAGGA